MVKQIRIFYLKVAQKNVGKVNITIEPDGGYRQCEYHLSDR